MTMMSNTGAAVGGAFDFDCDCGAWGTDDDFGSEFPFRPPHFDLPPPPLPPSLQPPPELCSSESFATAIAEETCQAFLVGGGGGGIGGDAEYQVPLDSPPSLAAIVVSAAILTAVIIIATLLFWRHRKQKEQQKMLLRCQQKTVVNGTGGGGGGVGVMIDATGVPALLQGLSAGRHHSASNDDETVFYDELISYPTHYRSTHHHPPVYEMKDVLLKSSPCHCTAHPLLSSNGLHQHHHQQQQQQQQQQLHYVASPYHGINCGGSVGGGSSSTNSAPSSSTTTTATEQPDSGSWITEPVYEELPSGTEDDIRTPRDYRHRAVARNGSINVNDSQRGNSSQQRGGGSVVRRPSLNGSSWSGETEPGETDFFLAPTTWYQQHNNSMLRAGQLTTQGPVRPGGRGGIRAAWREVEPTAPQHQPNQRSQSTGPAGRKKRKIKSGNNRSTGDQVQQQIYNNTPPMAVPPSSVESYHTMGLYRGRCPPEEPPFTAVTDDCHQLFDSPLGPLDPDESAEPVTTPTKTLPRYYYYSESDDYGVSNRQRSLSGSNGQRRGQQQRHLSRAQRTQQQQPPQRSPTFSDELAA